jgi:predicted naringenin-chalcone synthase
MFIVGLGTAAPPRRYTQAEGWEVVQKTKPFENLTPRSRAILKKVLTGRNGIVTRHLALDSLEEAFDLTPDAMHARFSIHAPCLAEQAARAALADARRRPEEVDALIISTCTGYLCPGLTSYVGERLSLPAHTLGLDLVGQGCGAAVPNLRTAEALVTSGRCRCVLSICVEVCSAAFFLDNDPGVLISACLFGDGAGAAVLEPQPNGSRVVEWVTSGSVINPADRDLLRFEQRQGMLRNILAPQVPGRAADYSASVLEDLLGRAGLTQSQIAGWIVHPGGREVLHAVQQRLGLSDADVRFSAEVLAEFGNLSSPSVFFILQRAIGDSTPGGFWWMSAFGAGFSAHGALLRVGAR